MSNVQATKTPVTYFRGSKRATKVCMIKKIFNKSIENTTIHGLRRIFDAKGIYLKLIWVIFLLTSTIFCLYSVIHHFIEYFEFPVITKMRYINLPETTFPRIAFCNSNPFATNYSIDFIIEYFRENNIADYTEQENLNKQDFLNDIIRVSSLLL